MGKLRAQHRERLRGLEDRILSMGNQTLDMLSEALAALGEGDTPRANAVIRADDRVDDSYRAIQADVFTTLALQSPVASELRMLAALIHVNIHIERIGDLCVNIAKFAGSDLATGEDPEIAAQLQEMAQHAARAVHRALDSFARRDLRMAHELPALDDPIDHLNRAVFGRTVELAAADQQRLDWALRMVLVARYLERVGDHAVDIAEQTVFAVTGETIELASNSPKA